MRRRKPASLSRASSEETATLLEKTETVGTSTGTSTAAEPGSNFNGSTTEASHAFCDHDLGHCEHGHLKSRQPRNHTSPRKRKGLSVVEEVDDGKEEAEEIDLFGGLGQYFSWSFSIISALLGLFVLCNLPTVAAMLDGQYVQLRLGNRVWFEFNI